jgi:adenylyltransferase/sulfurtransferase
MAVNLALLLDNGITHMTMFEYPPAVEALEDAQLLRYSRQIMLPEIDYAGQLALANSRVLIVGLGGLGSPVALYLAAAGIGHLTLVDFDRVDESNLQRQILHTQARVGINKARSAQIAVQALNPALSVQVIEQSLEEDALLKLAQAHQLIMDCSDNFATRFRLNHVSQLTQTPLVSGAVIRLEGQVSVFDPRQPDSPCYACLYKEEGEIEANCTTQGVLAPAVGLIGSLQAIEAIKLLVGLPSTLVGQLLLVDVKTLQFRPIKLRKDANCSCRTGV